MKWALPLLLLLLTLPQPVLADCEGEDQVGLRVRIVDGDVDDNRSKDRQYSFTGRCCCPPDSYGRDPFSVFEEPEAKPPTPIFFNAGYSIPKEPKPTIVEPPSAEPPSSEVITFESNVEWYHIAIIALVVLLLTIFILWINGYRKYHWKRYWLD
jgi:hypothetical protein